MRRPTGDRHPLYVGATPSLDGLFEVLAHPPELLIALRHELFGRDIGQPPQRCHQEPFHIRGGLLMVAMGTAPKVP